MTKRITSVAKQIVLQLAVSNKNLGVKRVLEKEF